LSPNSHDYESWTDFIYLVPSVSALEETEEEGESRTRINLIISALLMGSWGIIIAGRHFELKAEEKAKIKEREERSKKFNKRAQT